MGYAQAPSPRPRVVPQVSHLSHYYLRCSAPRLAVVPSRTTLTCLGGLLACVCRRSVRKASQFLSRLPRRPILLDWIPSCPAFSVARSNPQNLALSQPRARHYYHCYSAHTAYSTAASPLLFHSSNNNPVARNHTSSTDAQRRARRRRQSPFEL